MQCLLVVLMIPMIDTISLISVKTQVVLHSLELRLLQSVLQCCSAGLCLYCSAAVLASVCTYLSNDVSCWSSQGTEKVCSCQAECQTSHHINNVSMC